MVLNRLPRTTALDVAEEDGVVFVEEVRCIRSPVNCIQAGKEEMAKLETGTTSRIQAGRGYGDQSAGGSATPRLRAVSLC